KRQQQQLSGEQQQQINELNQRLDQALARHQEEVDRRVSGNRVNILYTRSHPWGVCQSETSLSRYSCRSSPSVAVSVTVRKTESLSRYRVPHLELYGSRANLTAASWGSIQ